MLLLLSPAADAFVTSSVSSSRFKAGLSGNSNDGNRVGQFAQVVLRQSSRVEVDVAREYVAVVDIAKKYVPAQSPRRENPLKHFSEGYSRLQSEHYLVMAFLQAGILASGADAATQIMEGASPVDLGHVAAMASVASTMSGVMNAVWLKQLENAFPGTGTKEVAAKTLIHAIIIASIINSAYLVGVPLFKEYFFGGSLHLPPLSLPVIFGGWKFDEFVTLTKLEVLMFIPYNTLAFKFVPPQVRPLTHAAISATFNVAVSAITLGYFNAWCENASSFISSH